jgi:hypothetical protein
LTTFSFDKKPLTCRISFKIRFFRKKPKIERDPMVIPTAEISLAGRITRKPTAQVVELFFTPPVVA